MSGIVLILVVFIIAVVVAKSSKDPDTKREANYVVEHILYGRQGKEEALKQWGCLAIVLIIMLAIIISFFSYAINNS